jgi:hypothetical protein
MAALAPTLPETLPFTPQSWLKVVPLALPSVLLLLAPVEWPVDVPTARPELWPPPKDVPVEVP